MAPSSAVFRAVSDQLSAVSKLLRSPVAWSRARSGFPKGSRITRPALIRVLSRFKKSCAFWLGGVRVPATVCSSARARTSTSSDGSRRVYAPGFSAAARSSESSPTSWDSRESFWKSLPSSRVGWAASLTTFDTGSGFLDAMASTRPRPAVRWFPSGASARRWTPSR